jgi:hypothetical protein
MEMCKLIFTFKGSHNLLKQRCVKGTSSICVGSAGAVMYLAELCICSKILRFRKRNSWNSGHLYLRKWRFTRTIDFTVDTSSQFLSSVRKAFTSENTLSTAAFVPGKDKENSTTVLIFLRVYSSRPLTSFCWRQQSHNKSSWLYYFYDGNIKYQGKVIRIKTQSNKCRKNLASVW